MASLSKKRYENLTLYFPVTDEMKHTAIQEEQDYYATEESKRTHVINASTRNCRDARDGTRLGFLGEMVFEKFLLLNNIPYTSPRFNSTSAYWQKHKFDKGGDTDFILDGNTVDVKTSEKGSLYIRLNVNAPDLARKPSNYYVLVWSCFEHPLGYVLGFAPYDVIAKKTPLNPRKIPGWEYHSLTRIWPFAEFPLRTHLKGIEPQYCTTMFNQLLEDSRKIRLDKYKELQF